MKLIHEAKVCIESCLKIRLKNLGNEHFETGKAKFQLGRINFFISLHKDKLPDIDSYDLVKESFANMESHSSGQPLHYCFMAETCGHELGENGMLGNALDILKRRYEVM